MKYVLTIAGSDPSGGAGVQADLKTFADLGVPAVSAITAITAQDDDSLVSIHPTPADVLTQQISMACKGKNIAAIKIGMIATRANARAIAWFLNSTKVEHVIIDPVLYSSSGHSLLEPDAFTFFRLQLLPLASLITPNLAEAESLAGMNVDSLETMKAAAEAIYKETSSMRSHAKRGLAILIKGGHLSGDAIDVFYDGKNFNSFISSRVAGKSPRGTGCRFASAIAANLALGHAQQDAISKAKEYMSKYISAAF